VHKGNTSSTWNEGKWGSDKNKASVGKFKAMSGKPISTNKNSLWDQRRAQGLCVKCGDKYFLGHQCTTKLVNVIQAIEEAAGC
jgi:ribosomal protein L37AE/L43A